MWWYILQNTILSICIMVILQYIWDYLKTNYTTRKTKHIVDLQTQKYRDIIKDIQTTPQVSTPNVESDYSEYISEKEKEKMIRELTQFLHTNHE